MMEYQDFLQKLQDDLSGKMPEMVFMPHEVKGVQREAYDGISVTPKGNRVGVILNTEALYSMMKNGVDYGQIVMEAENFIKNRGGLITDQDIEFLPEYRKVRENLTVELIGREQNREGLTGIPHRDIGDMALIYRISIGHFEGARATALVTNEMLKSYGITTEQLHQDALNNTAEKQPFTIIMLDSLMNGLMEISEQDSDFPAEQETEGLPPFYVASNLSMMNGAAVIAYPHFMEEAAEKLGGDFFVLPSSIHEVMLLKDDGQLGYRELEDIVISANAEAVPPEERLSGTVYHYDSVEKVFETAEKFEHRKQEREAQPRSVLEELKNLKEKTEQHKPKLQTRPVPAYGASL